MHRLTLLPMILAGVLTLGALAAVPAHRPRSAALKFPTAIEYPTQGFAQPTCTGHAAAIAAQAAIFRNGGPDVPLSGEFVQLQAYTDLGLTGGGVRPHHAMAALLDHGVCTETLCRNTYYIRWRLTGEFTPAAVTDALSRRIASWRYLADVDDLVESVRDGHTAVVGFQLPPSLRFDALDHVETYSPGVAAPAHAGAIIDLAGDGTLLYVDPRNIPKRVKTLSRSAAAGMLHSLDPYSPTAPQRVIIQWSAETAL